MLTKSRVSALLLWGLIPLGIYGFASLIGVSVFGNRALPSTDLTDPWVLLWFFGVLIGWPAWWLALIVGIVLRFLVSRANRRIQREGQAYAERHGWQTISRTQWKSFKRGGVTLTVVQATQSPEYLLRVEVEGEIVGTDGFETALFALHFGDYMWDNLLSGQGRVDASMVQQHRAQWEQTRALTLR